ncbi:MAG: protoglobin domain-containing protein [Nitrospirota bacterium]|nr:protoglobin domain-containing protein [Nitrospirota bacterium]
MLNIPVPYEKLLQFQSQLGLTDEALWQLDPYRKVFASKKDDFSAYFHEVFQKLPEAKLVLDYEQRPGHMLKVWSYWFGKIFNSSLDADLHAYLWKIGLRHVEVNLDQRFSNLGFSIIRQFCHKIVLADTEHGDKTAVLQLIDKIVDFCLLVETSAYIEATTRCDIEIIKGIADRVRNPVTVIGGSLKRLQRKFVAGSPAYKAYEGLLGENRRLEHMVIDIKTYFEMFQETPKPETVRIDELFSRTFDKLPHDAMKIETGFSPDALIIKADAKDMAAAFYHILENSFEAADPDNPLVTLSSRRVMEPHPGIEVAIFNIGRPFKVSDMDKLATPFYSTKPSGTGFGIPIIRLAMRKNHGKVTFEPVEEQGTRVTMILPFAEG